MAKYALCYLLVALVFGALDFVWLSLAGPHLYRPALGPILSDKVQVAPAALFYVLYVGGLIGFVAAPALQAGDWAMALGRGAAFGLVAYAAYDLTNQATMKAWPIRVTLADLGWGAFASAVACAVGVFATARISAALGWN